MRRILQFAAILYCAVPSSASAQLSAAIDVGYDHSFIWRGLTRVSRPNLQPALSLAWTSPSLQVSAGGWAVLEPASPRIEDFTLAGPDQLIGEVDAWAQTSYRLKFFAAHLDLTAGLTAYTFHGRPDAGLSDSLNAVELAAAIRFTGLDQLYPLIGLPPDLPIGLEAMAAFDFGPVGGVYLETGLRSDLPILFVGEPIGSIILRLLTGFSWNQEFLPGQPGRYDGEGLTHLALSATATPFFQLGPLPTTVSLTGYVQYGFDDATRRRRLNSDSKIIPSFETTVSILLPARRKP